MVLLAQHEAAAKAIAIDAMMSFIKIGITYFVTLITRCGRATGEC
jgi:hypothetical protein